MTENDYLLNKSSPSNTQDQNESSGVPSARLVLFSPGGQRLNWGGASRFIIRQGRIF